MTSETSKKHTYMLNLEHITAQVADLARATGRHIVSLRRSQDVVVQAKGPHDFVTQMDKLSERLLVDGLERILPEAGFITEEHTRTDRAERYNWVVDPIDGTTNFIHNYRYSAISVGVCDCGM